MFTLPPPDTCWGDPGATVPATPFERGQYYVQTFSMADDPPDYAGLTVAGALQALADQDDAYELGTHTYTEQDATEFLRGVRAARGAL